MGSTGKNDRRFLSELPHPLGLGPSFSEVCKKLQYGFILKFNLVHYAFSRPLEPMLLGPEGPRPIPSKRFPPGTFVRRSEKFDVPFYWIGHSGSKSGGNLCVQDQETKPMMAWKKVLLPLLAKLEEEENVQVAKLEEEKVNVTELEKLKVKVPRFIKELILVLHMHQITADMRRSKRFRLKMRRRIISDKAYYEGGEMALEEAIVAMENEIEAELYKTYATRLGLKGRLKRGFEEVEVPDDNIPN